MALVIVWKDGWVCTAKAPVIGDTTAQAVLSCVPAQVMSVTDGMAAARRDRSAAKGSGDGVVNTAVCVTTKQPAIRQMGNVSARRDLGDLSVR